MNYRINQKNNDRLSILGFGCMRFDKDEKEVEKQILYAIENGINYFDTAYIYPNSEIILGKILAKGQRKNVKIATKMPPYLIKKNSDFDKIFNTQLQRLQTDYIDYYLMHMLADVKTWNRLLGLGFLEWLEDKKKSGKILNLGFSYHGGQDEFRNLIDIYNWDFCMIQYNYLDENKQAGKSGLEYASAKGMPVIIMEPLRGGKLVTNMPDEVYKHFDQAEVKRTPAEWALRWVWNHPQVTLLLSGMNSMDMINENIRIASDAKSGSLNDKELLLFEQIKKILEKKTKVPCTGCNYCMPCPAGVDIPTCFSCYNDREIEGKISALKKYVMLTSLKTQSHNASLCTKCRKCESHCPQNIVISEEITKVAKVMEGIYYKPMLYLARKLMKL